MKSYTRQDVWALLLVASDLADALAQALWRLEESRHWEGNPEAAWIRDAKRALKVWEEIR